MQVAEFVGATYSPDLAATGRQGERLNRLGPHFFCLECTTYVDMELIVLGLFEFCRSTVEQQGLIYRPHLDQLLNF